VRRKRNIITLAQLASNYFIAVAHVRRVYILHKTVFVFLSIHISCTLILSMARDFYNDNSTISCRRQRADINTCMRASDSSIVMERVHYNCPTCTNALYVNASIALRYKRYDWVQMLMRMTFAPFRFCRRCLRWNVWIGTRYGYKYY
jgi:hypothetical protein